MPKTINLSQIKKALKTIDPVGGIIPLIEEGFVTYSTGKAVVPLIGEMVFVDPPKEAHIKYGYIKGDDYYVIKIASAFYKRTRREVVLCNGFMRYSAGRRTKWDEIR